VKEKYEFFVIQLILVLFMGLLANLALYVLGLLDITIYISLIFSVIIFVILQVEPILKKKFKIKKWF
jgi:hypothetical protein